MRLIMLVQPFYDFGQPGIQHDGITLFFPRVQSRKAANDAGAALGDNQLGIRNKKQGRAHHRQRGLLNQFFGQLIR